MNLPSGRSDSIIHCLTISNLYTYALHNPLRFRDSSGLDPDEIVPTGLSGGFTGFLQVVQPPQIGLPPPRSTADRTARLAAAAALAASGAFLLDLGGHLTIEGLIIAGSGLATGNVPLAIGGASHAADIALCAAVGGQAAGSTLLTGLAHATALLVAGVIIHARMARTGLLDVRSEPQLSAIRATALGLFYLLVLLARAHVVFAAMETFVGAPSRSMTMFDSLASVA